MCQSAATLAVCTVETDTAEATPLPCVWPNQLTLENGCRSRIAVDAQPVRFVADRGAPAFIMLCQYSHSGYEGAL